MSDCENYFTDSYRGQYTDSYRPEADAVYRPVQSTQSLSTLPATSAAQCGGLAQRGVREQ